MQQNPPTWLREIPAAETLRQGWVQQYRLAEGAGHWRASDDIPPASVFISSPYDHDAHDARKHSTQGVGYKVHLTEACEDDLPGLIPHVATTAGPTADGEATPALHAALKAKGRLPGVHLVDTGFLDAARLVSSRADDQVELVGPTRSDDPWQARDGTGFAVEHFHIDWERQQARCPEGRTSISWTPAVAKRTNQVIKVKFSRRDCRRCPSRAHGTRSQKNYPRRTITIRAQEEYRALQAARQREGTPEFAAVYAKRAGVEGTLSRGVRTCRLRRTRYNGQAKTHLGHLSTAVGLNFLRLGEWFIDRPRARTRRSPFVALMADAQAA